MSVLRIQLTPLSSRHVCIHPSKPEALVANYGGVDPVYHEMLSKHVDPNNKDVASLTHSIFALYQALPEATSLKSFIPLILASFLGVTDLPILKNAAWRLVRLLDYGAIQQGRLRYLSRSFTLFLQGSSTSSFVRGPLPSTTHEQLATICLDCMEKELRFDICRFPSSFLRNKDVPNLDNLADAHISSRLRYACQHWAVHVSETAEIPLNVLERISEFFERHLLSWFEVMSILGLSPEEPLRRLKEAHVREFVPLII